MPIDARWLQGAVTPDERRVAKDKLASGNEVFYKLKKMLQDMYDESLSVMQSGDFSSPSWALMMADKLAEQRTLKKVIDLLPLE